MTTDENHSTDRQESSFEESIRQALLSEPPSEISSSLTPKVRHRVHLYRRQRLVLTMTASGAVLLAVGLVIRPWQGPAVVDGPQNVEPVRLADSGAADRLPSANVLHESFRNDVDGQVTVENAAQADLEPGVWEALFAPPPVDSLLVLQQHLDVSISLFDPGEESR